MPWITQPVPFNIGQGAAAAGGSETLPPDYDELGAWYDASSSSSITASAGRVSQWNDKKGSADLIQEESSDQPLVVSADQNDLDVINFVGDRYMDTGSLTGISQPTNWYIALTGFASTGTLKRPMWSGSQQVFTSNSTPNGWKLYAGEEPSFTEDIGTSFQIWRIVFNGSSSYWYVNGSAKMDGVDAGTGSAGGLAIGAASDGGAPSNNKFGEILRYDADVSSENDSLIMTYLNDKWGL